MVVLPRRCRHKSAEFATGAPCWRVVALSEKRYIWCDSPRLHQSIVGEASKWNRGLSNPGNTDRSPRARLRISNVKETDASGYSTIASDRWTTSVAPKSATAGGSSNAESEVVALRVGDVDGQRRTPRIEQGKCRKDRYVMLSPVLLEGRSRSEQEVDQRWEGMSNRRLIRSHSAMHAARHML
jgi:hypothetical protein